MNSATYYEDPRRLRALKQFATTSTIITILGHLYFGFEQAYVLPFLSLATTYTVQLVLEAVRAFHEGDAPRFSGGGARRFIEFLLPAHIVGLSCAMFIYPGARLWPIVFVATLAIATKFLIQVKIDGRARHFLNPTNAGVVLALVLFPEVGVILPYQFSSHLGDKMNVAIPIILFTLGTLLNGRVTKRLPLVAGWLGAFVFQAVCRHFFFGASAFGVLAPATGTIAMLYTFYMVTDPGTTPAKPLQQVLFGAAIGLTYGVFVVMHVVFAIFWALFAVCTARGIYHFAVARIGAQGGQNAGRGGRETDIEATPTATEALPRSA